MNVLRYMNLKCLIILLVFGSPLYGQLQEDFSDGNITSNPSWIGDVSDFIVDAEGELQLNGSGAATSTIFTEVDYPDSIQFDFYFRMELNPSDNNNSTIYLSVDDTDLSVASGYYIQVGENGSNDALQLYYLNKGTPDLISVGSLGALASSPAEARVRIVKFPDGMWELSASYDGGSLLTSEIIASDNRYTLGAGQFFGIQCQYTSSNTTRYHFDDINVSKYLPDTTPPILAKVDVINEQQLLVSFDEVVTNPSAQNVSNYSLDNGQGNPLNAILISSSPNQVLLGLNTPLTSGIIYTLTVSNIEDEEGNIMTESPTMELFLSLPPDVGDVLLSEVLFDPYSGGEDFVELYNHSDKFIMLNGLILRNDQKDEESILQTTMVLLPGEYIAITPDKPFLEDNYTLLFPDRVISNDLPSLNNADGNISIKNGSGAVIDSYDYSEDFHYILLDDTEGVSLERLSFDADTNADGNWTSAASAAGFATPGYENSNFLMTGATGENFSLERKVFSPDGDGDGDRLLLIYDLEKPGYLANFKVYDVDGFEITQIANNQLLSTNGLIFWDGTNSEGNRANIGMYIIYGEAIHPDGDVKIFKEVCVLAELIE